MTSPNPYAPPRAEVTDIGPVDAGQVFQPVRIWSVRGRVGRLRYLAYLLGGYFVFSAGALLLGLVGQAIGITWIAPAAWMLLLVPYLITVAVLSIQRSHDMNFGGWAAFLVLVPLVSLLLVLGPGTRGPNRFGAPPPPNTAGVKIIAALVLVFFVGGIVAAIALPAYSDYRKRAEAAGRR